MILVPAARSDPTITAMSKLDKEMYSILRNPNLSPLNKIKMYFQTLQRNKEFEDNYTNQFGEPPIDANAIDISKHYNSYNPSDTSLRELSEQQKTFLESIMKKSLNDAEPSDSFSDPEPMDGDFSHYFQTKPKSTPNIAQTGVKHNDSPFRKQKSNPSGTSRRYGRDNFHKTIDQNRILASQYTPIDQHQIPKYEYKYDPNDV